MPTQTNPSTSLPYALDRHLTHLLPLGGHGSAVLPDVRVDSYSVELREGGRFLGDTANKKALTSALESKRQLFRARGDDPLGRVSSNDISKKALEKILIKGDAAGTAVVQLAMEEYCMRFAHVVRQFMKLRDWKHVRAIAIGGGLRTGRLGELTIARTQALLNEAKLNVELCPIMSHPDEAALLGAVHLLPAWMLEGHEAILATDIGGTNVRCGLVKLNYSRKRRSFDPAVVELETWNHSHQRRGRAEAVGKVIKMLQKLSRRARKDSIRLAPFIGVGCPGRVRFDGFLDRGTQNLPGNWRAQRFNLAYDLRESVGIEGYKRPMVLLHNDAVLQGLSEKARLLRHSHWAVMTLGTGLGNAKFTTLDASP